MRAERWNQKGMITVEAAFLVPGLLLIIVWLVYFMLFLLDMSVVKSETRRIANEAAVVWKTDGELVDGSYDADALLSRPIRFLLWGGKGEWKEKGVNRGNRRIRSRLSVAELSHVEIKLSGDRVKVSGTVKMNGAFSQVAQDWGMEALTFTGTSCRKIENWEEWLRAAACLEEKCP